MTATPPRLTPARPVAVLAALLLAFPAFGPLAQAADDPLEEVKSLIELGQALVDAGVELGDDARVAKGLAKFKAAQKTLASMATRPGVTTAQKNRIERYVVDVEARLDWYDSSLFRKGRGSGPPEGDEDTPEADPEVRAPKRRPGERMGGWCGRVMQLYAQTESGTGRAALTRQMSRQAGVLALRTLYRLFDTEANEDARTGVREGLARIGTSRVANRMAGYARAGREARWDDALDVIYRCLEKPERIEPERPWQRAIRAFHKLKQRKLSLKIITHLDRMGAPGIAALGEIVYVPDFGYHNHTIQLLAKKQDTRAVPPLIFKLNRFKFERRVQMPAHKALLQMGWYAVPGLVKHLDNHAAGIWISWTLRKITGETMGTDKRKWHHWWQEEKVRHPELFADPDERPAVVTGK